MTIYRDLNDAPQKHYGLILADPAWKFKTFSPQEGKPGNRGAERHYPTMTIAQMRELDVKRVAGRDCWLAMWCTWPHLKTGLDLLEHWGFRYSSDLFVWFKMKKSFSPTRAFITLPHDMHIGTGYTSRKNTEFVLLGRRGSPKVMAKDVHEPIFSPVRQHSRKPDEQYERIERFAAGANFLEMNARTERPGWDQWGNQVETFAHPAAAPALPARAEPGEVPLFPAPRFSMAPGADDLGDELVIPSFLRRLANS